MATLPDVDAAHTFGVGSVGGAAADFLSWLSNLVLVPRAMAGGSEGVVRGAKSSVEVAGRKLSPPGRVVFASGDLTVNTVLAALSLVYATYFLTQIAGLRPVLAGLVPFVGRIVDAVSDPLIGRLSDRTTLRGGRRRPYFLIGAIPFGVTFALLWLDPGFTSQTWLFAYYAVVYCLLSVSATVVSVPYLALIPEMATDYDDRTSLNTYRTIGAILGVFGAILLRPVARALGGGSVGFAWAGILYGVLLVVPWFLIYRVTFERKEFAPRASTTSMVTAFRLALQRRSFLQLMGFYLTGRVAMDLVGSLLILYFTYYLGRGDDFESAMALFLLASIVTLPIWLRFSLRRDKATIFQIGCVIWIAAQIAMAFAPSDASDWVLYGIVCLTGIGFGVVDLMPWAMLGEVVDEDELDSGERREGIYNGLFMFLRKLAGALAVLFVLSLLDVLGFEQAEVQSEHVRTAIVVLTTAAPAVFLLLSVWLAQGYPLTRKRHEQILVELEERPSRSTP